MKLHPIIHFFVQNFDLLEDAKIPLKIKQEINRLDRSERNQLRNELFERAKLFEQSQSTEQIINWLQQSIRIIDKNSFHFNHVFFSPGNEIKDSIGQLLRDARYNVDLCVFTITDTELAQQILDCHNRNVKVRIITDDEKIMDNGSEIHLLKQSGIAVKTDRSHYHMHNKFGIIDRRIAITGSFNWTYTATKHNQENLLATSKYEIVKQYLDEFERLWAEMFNL